jgi:hypothetical protein
MDAGGYAHAIRAQVVKFNGEFFRRKTVLPMSRKEIGELRQAAGYNWRDVDPSIFGTLLEQALNKDERRKLGAHYTPRAYVERLVIATIIEPLRGEWNAVLGSIARSCPRWPRASRWSGWDLTKVCRAKDERHAGS